ncbi:hypothetical protein [Aquiflexum sp.]|uniref:hypothetical protein n=1 Tax=Aquiflexum sp. TaxID=1872584 RepID=UPI0035946497
MKTTTMLIVFCFLLSWNQAIAQSENQKNYRNFPIVLTLQFHALSMPIKDMKSNLKNVGFGIGTEVSHNGSHNWAQQFDIIWIKNRGIGNGILFSTQTAWRPMVVGNVYSEVKAGIGYMIGFRPSESFTQKDGNWISVGKKGKGMLTLPLGIGMGYYNHSQNMFVSPFLGYQFMLVKNYNLDLPFVPQSLLQMGGRIHPDYSKLGEN